MTRFDPKQLVRAGYDAVSYRYRQDTDEPAEYLAWLADLRQRVPAGGTVLDLGCGCGVPVSRSLAAHGYAVTGVDISEVQVRRARLLVPAGTFHRADATGLDLPAATFDAVVFLYTLIHIPRDEHPGLLSRIAAWLRPGGWLLATTGATSWEGVEENWLDSGAPMWWSHSDAASYRRRITAAGLHIESEEFVPEGTAGHQLFWARKAATGVR
ncbi:MAG TPA: class I SAM-dependent methyltransferase [Micromonosporaceae bacterium]|nr:class I SAM-dependent methyltransferase [Micromonosporaceae bacterium]